MKFTSNSDKYPDAVEDPRWFGGWYRDGDGNEWGKEDGCPFRNTVYVDTVTGEVRMYLRPCIGSPGNLPSMVVNHGRGEMVLATVMLTPPLLAYSRDNVLLNPEDECPNPCVVVNG